MSNDKDLINEDDLTFLQLKNQYGECGGLKKPSNGVYLIVETAQKVFQSEILDRVTMHNLLPSGTIICDILVKKAMVQLHNKIGISDLFPVVRDSNLLSRGMVVHTYTRYLWPNLFETLFEVQMPELCDTFQ